jgi:hypothetical protein
MNWGQALSIMVVLFIGLALGKAAAEERPSQIDRGLADAPREVISAGSPWANSYRVPTSSVDLSAALDELVQAPPLLADIPSIGPLPSLDDLASAPPFLVDAPNVTAICRRWFPAAWPATAVGRLSWLQRLLF